MKISTVDNIKKFNDSFWISPDYETGKNDVEYMTQDGYTLMSCGYRQFEVELAVNGECRFTHEEQTYKYEDDLDSTIVELIRKGQVEFEDQNWFEFFSRGEEEAYNVGHFSHLPTPGMMKSLLVEDLLYQASQAEAEEEADFLKGFDYFGVNFETNERFKKEEFEKCVHEIMTHQDLFDVIPFFESDFIQDEYGYTRFGVFLYTENQEAKSYVREKILNLYL